MDPKTANLDPKLKEAYDRIMGTSVPPPVQKKETQAANTAKPTETPFPQAPKMQVEEVAPEPSTKPFPPLPTPPIQPLTIPNEMVQSPVFNASKNVPLKEQSFANGNLMQNSVVSQETPKKKNKLMPVILTLGGLVFFILYGVIWAKVFSLF